MMKTLLVLCLLLASCTLLQAAGKPDVTHIDKPENYPITTDRWRYIHYFDGSEELYDIETDQHEWTNLAAKSERTAQLAEMWSLALKQLAPVPVPGAAEGEKK
jgi:arylsulfatase A-like enzyme